ncbi:DNA-binding response regulator [Bifidobacterium lemurum]|uniref:DNA-binding response regulator n=1 Tax=Bifidobacterium lemurum TaxID=1603886 RepID=A0A261FUK0_9BIFI|nr:LytTR family DNA-binding domain-containing protein [Bifidobacterium lemurum]OZG62871.1 DNA-binding response regulator [Bifidobacterium lemurum]QOL35196.1 response regulator transcription factor [Bifidobacterium lemurum]
MEAVIQVAIVEDETEYARTLEDYLTRYGEEIGERFAVTRFPDGEDIVANYRTAYDIILMDIEMASMDGMTAAERIREIDREVVIMFITNMAQYAIQGYKVDALDYVLKPISYFAFTQRLGRAISRMRRREETYVTITAKNSTSRVPVSSILWIESSGHRLAYHTKEGVFESTTSSMKEVEERLRDEGFFRCNKGYLVNLAHVRGVEDGCAKVGGDLVMVSRAKQRELLDALANYLGAVAK